MSRLRAPFLAAIVGGAALVSGCNDGIGQTPIGSDDTDGFRLAEVPAMAHIARAIDGSDLMTLGDLIEEGDDVVFAEAPNPGDYLTATNTVDDGRERTGRAPLSVLTWNVALLDVSLFNVIPYTQSPDMSQRRRTLPGLAFDSGADIILMQEVWLDEDVEAFSKRAVTSGYRVFGHDRGSGNDGLIVFIKADVIAGGSTSDVDFAPYASQVGTEYWPGPAIARGWMHVRFVHKDIGTVHVFNTHMQAFPENWLGRVKQARELGIAMQRARSETPGFSLVGGDFNSGPYYKSATWVSPDASSLDRWHHNAVAWPTLLTYGDLIDAAIMGRPAADATADIVLGDTVRNDPGAAEAIPGAVEGWCEQTPQTTFTATDCNSLYFQQYAGTEAPARLDHIFVDNTERVIATSSQLVFTQKQAFGDLDIEPSDHYGVRVDLLVTPQ
ncbi:MAG TPA: endonuclease/exonuclease/phosphatase family protein [Myxococcota bacterium]